MANTFETVGAIITGAGCLEELGAVAARLGKRALVVSGCGSLEKAGVLDRARESLRKAGVEFEEHPGVPREPALAAVDELRERLRDGVEVVISIGGGSVMDVAKAAAGLAREEGAAGEYQSGREIVTRGLPHVAVPTTAGTGSEVTPNAVVTDPEVPRKASIRGEALLPAAAIVDPELLVPLPPRTTAESGMDALAQAVESYVSVHATPLTEALSLHAVTLLARGLARAVEEGSDIEARADCAYGSLAAGMALANARLGVVHGIAHPVGARHDLPHGLICAVLLAPSIRLNESSAPEKYAEIARRLSGGFASAATQGLTRAGITREEVERRSPGADRLVETLLDAVELPRRLPCRIDENDFAAIVADSMPSGSLKANPLRVEPRHLEALLREVSA